MSRPVTTRCVPWTRRLAAILALFAIVGVACDGSPRGCHQPAKKPEPLPFLCHDRTGLCFTVQSSCIQFLTVFGGDCFEIQRAWCLRVEDLDPRYRDPNMECYTSYAGCADVFRSYDVEEQCFTLDDAWILHEHMYWR